MTFANHAGGRKDLKLHENGTVSPANKSSLASLKMIIAILECSVSVFVSIFN